MRRFLHLNDFLDLRVAEAETDQALRFDGDKFVNGHITGRMHSGSGAPSASLGQDDDFYLDLDTNNVYVKSGGSWSQQGVWSTTEDDVNDVIIQDTQPSPFPSDTLVIQTGLGDGSDFTFWFDDGA